MAVTMGSFWSLGTKNHNWEQNLNFTHDALQEMRFEFQKATFWRKLKKLTIFKSLPLPFGLMYFNETWHICLVVLFCYQEWIHKNLLEYFWRCCNPNLEKWRKGKVTLFPCWGKKNLRIYFWHSLQHLKHDQSVLFVFLHFRFQKWDI